MERIGSLEAFWPYYLSEHRSPLDRALHFVGTSWFFVVLAGCFVSSPWWFPPAFLLGAALTWFGAARVEPRRPAFLPMLGMLALGVAAQPWFLAGVAGAYAFAWTGHFLVEKNRPATFRYPVWSFLCDFRMWGAMATGRLWSGDPVAAVTRT
jgi:hypothetical protein